MTPEQILSKDTFVQPLIISPKYFTCFNYLLDYRNEIRTLELVPIKDDSQHDHYNSLNKEELFKKINSQFEDSEIFASLNEYPYWLPEDCLQYLIWVKNSQVNKEKIIQFIAKYILFLSVLPEEIILFDRPLNTKSILVKGSFPQIRHIHLWIRK